MRRRVVITGTGVVAPLGYSGAALHAALLAGESALGPVTLFPTDGRPAPCAGEVRGFDAQEHLGEGNLRPLDRMGRLVVAAAGKALADAGYGRELRAEREVGLVLGTMFCGLHTIAEFDRRNLTRGPSYASPLDFANTVINAAAGQTAIWHDLRGINSTLSAGAASGLQALAYGADVIRSGRADALLAGGADELCFETYLGFARTGGLSGAAPAVPFDARRGGFALSEGAALLMLEEAESAARRGARVLAEVLGGGGSYDPSRGSDPRRAARAVELSVLRALAEAEVAAGEVDAVWAAANGSVAGDRAEAAGLAAALGSAPDHRTVPVTAVKAMLGEALGASGPFAAVDALMAMGDGRLPGIAGLVSTEEGFPLSVSPHSREVAVRRAVVGAAGLDGAASALVLARTG